MPYILETVVLPNLSCQRAQRKVISEAVFACMVQFLSLQFHLP